MLCETPLHAGSGDDLGLVDLPIQREKHTGFPKIEASSLKGALREAFENTPGKENDRGFQIDIHRVFGYDEAFAKSLNEEDKKSHQIVKHFADNTQFSGCLALSDARLLLFPVKSMKGVFVWLTCPQVLNKFAADMQIAGITVDSLAAFTNFGLNDGEALTSSQAPLHSNAVILEEFAFDAKVDDSLQKLATTLSELVFKDAGLAYWKNLLQKNLVLLNDTDFRDFTTMSTEVITRIKIDNETGTVEDGALFTEEYLPTDSVLYALAVSSDDYSKSPDKKDAAWAMNFFSKNMTDHPIFQLGGNATLGKGILRTTLQKETNHG